MSDHRIDDSWWVCILIVATAGAVAPVCALQTMGPWDPPVLNRPAVCGTVSWLGSDEDPRWSNPANWEGGMVPGPCHVASLGPGAGDAVVDPDFAGRVAGVRLARGYFGILRLGRDLVVDGELVLDDGRLEQGPHRFAVGALNQAGGVLAGGSAPLWIEGDAEVSGGILVSPSSLMRVESMTIDAPGSVRMGRGA